jgi:hypothetical protein
MVVTLKKHGITLPDAFFTVGNNFRPNSPHRRIDPKEGLCAHLASLTSHGHY